MKFKKNDSTWFELRDAKNIILINETANSITVKYVFEKDTLIRRVSLQEKTHLGLD